MKLRPLSIAIACLHSLTSFAAPVETRSASDFLRALQKVQDEIARGDVSAIALQKPLSEELLNALENPLLNTKDEFGWALAAIGYSLNGAHPKISRRLLARIGEDDPHHELAKAISEYTTGSMTTAANLFKTIQLDRLDPRLAPYVALAAATANLEIDPARSIELFHLATVLGSGTLVEEVALRRLAMIAVEKHDPELFERSSNLYIRRYSSSPFVGQFLSHFAENAIKLLSGEKTMELLSLAESQNAAHGIPVALSLAENSALAGKMDMVRLIVDNHLKASPIKVGAVAEKIKLYELIANQSKSTIEGMSAARPEIDTVLLSANEKRLLSKSQQAIEDILKPLSIVEKDKTEIAKKLYETAKQEGEPEVDAEQVPTKTAEAEGTVKLFEDIDKLSKDVGPMLESVDLLLKE